MLQSGEDLMELAEQGDNAQVDEFLTDIFGRHMQQLPPLKVFSFGKLHRDDDANASNTIAALLLRFLA
jgi:pantothenate kinase